MAPIDFYFVSSAKKSMKHQFLEPILLGLQEATIKILLDDLYCAVFVDGLSSVNKYDLSFISFHSCIEYLKLEIEE